MSLAVERFDARSWPGGELDPLFEGAFPAYITADQAAKGYIGRTREWFAEWNIIMVEDGTAAEWEAWTGMALPATGDYVIPGGLSILHLDTGEDLGTYTEPNVWVRHQ